MSSSHSMSDGLSDSGGGSFSPMDSGDDSEGPQLQFPTEDSNLIINVTAQGTTADLATEVIDDPEGFQDCQFDWSADGPVTADSGTEDMDYVYPDEDGGGISFTLNAATVAELEAEVQPRVAPPEVHVTVTISNIQPLPGEAAGDLLPTLGDDTTAEVTFILQTNSDDQDITPNNDPTDCGCPGSGSDSNDDSGGNADDDSGSTGGNDGGTAPYSTPPALANDPGGPSTNPSPNTPTGPGSARANEFRLHPLCLAVDGQPAALSAYRLGATGSLCSAGLRLGR